MTPAARRPGWLAMATVVSLAALSVPSCSPVSRYRVLSAVFDGVPPPPGMEVPAPALETQGPTSALSDGLARLRAERRPRAKPGIVILSVHKPVADRQCDQCHNLDSPGGDMAKDATLCDKCHADQRREQGWDHGPINLGTCIPCHLPHRSSHEHLLAMAVPDLCLNCHQAVTPEGPDYHRVDNFASCTTCHDPHRMY